MGRNADIDAKEETFTPRQAAVALGVSRSAVQRFLADDRIAYRKVGSRYRIPRSALEQFRREYIKALAADLANDLDAAMATDTDDRPLAAAR